MNMNEDKIYTKIINLDEIYKFIVQIFSFGIILTPNKNNHKIYFCKKIIHLCRVQRNHELLKTLQNLGGDQAKHMTDPGPNSN